MEIKIKNNEELIDATIEVKDGIMIVSPIKKEKFEPKDGDVLAIEDGEVLQLLICKEFLDDYECSGHCFYDVDSDELSVNDDCGYSVDRYATEEEKQKLFAKLAESGWEWDAENKKLVKWKPKYSETYFYPRYNPCEFMVGDYSWGNHSVDNILYYKGWCFKTEQECQAFCDRLNEAINQVKP